MRDPTRKKLTIKEENFVEEYVLTGRGKESAILAGYARANAAGTAWQLLQFPAVAQKIAERRAEIAKTHRLSRDRLVEEMARVAYMDVRKLFDSNGKPLPIHMLSDDAAAPINGIEVCTQGNDVIGYAEITKYKLSEKNKALENLAKILGYFEKDNASELDQEKSLAEQFKELSGQLPL